MLVALAEAIAGYAYFSGRAPILSGGNDWLAYESYARDALLNGWLINGGRPPGQGETFYYQPLYIYFLAWLHAFLGESVQRLQVAQYALVAVAGVLTYGLARELFGRGTALVALGVFWVYRYLIFNQVAGLLLSENLVALLIPAMLLALVRWQRTWRSSHLLAGGTLLGLAILTRSTPLLFLPPAVAIVALAQLQKFRHWRTAVGAAGLLLGVTLAISSLVAVRNQIVAGRPALLPESASANLWEAHRPSRGVDLTGIDRDPLYNRLDLDRQTREVVEFARQDPAGYGGSLAIMGLYAIGFTGPALGTSQIQYELVLLAAFYLGGILFVPAARRRAVWLLHAFVLTHFLQMMIFLSHQYGFRLPLPMYGPMIVIAAATLSALAARFVAVPKRYGEARESASPGWSFAQPLLVLIVLGLIALSAGWQLFGPREVEARVFGLGGTAGPAAELVASSPEAWLADRVYFSGSDQRSFGVAYLPGLRYREMKWLDSSSAFVWPAENVRGLLVEPERGSGRRAWCSSPPREGPELQQLVRKGPLIMSWLPSPDGSPCGEPVQPMASFGGLIDLLGAAREPPGPSGQAGVQLAWTVLERPTFRAQPVVELLGADDTVLATSMADPYPSGSWERGELVVARVNLPGGAVASGQPLRLGIGFTRGSPTTRLTINDPLPLYGQTRVISVE